MLIGMTITKLIGGFFGDEGKGKQTGVVLDDILKRAKIDPEQVVDIIEGSISVDEFLAKQKTRKLHFSEHADRYIAAYNIRTNGGPNGGHALTIGSKRVSGHLLPSAMPYPNALAIIGRNCGLHPKKLVAEIDDFRSNNFFNAALAIDDQVPIILDAYCELDGRRNGMASTGSGISYVYGKKGERVGLKVRDLLDEQRLVEHLKHKLIPFLHGEYLTKLLIERRKDFSDHKLVDLMLKSDDFKEFTNKHSIENVVAELRNPMKVLSRYVSSTINDGLREGILNWVPVIDEGSQSYFLGINSGIELGSSSMIEPGNLFSYQNVPIRQQKVIYVVKATGSRVGQSYFIGEFGDRNQALRKADLLESMDYSRDAKREEYLGKAIEMIRSSDPQIVGDGLRLFYQEYGETTGRPRGKAPIDLVALRTLYEQTTRGSINEDTTELWINQVDGLEHFDRVPVIVAYKDQDGKKYKTLPQWQDHELSMLESVV